MPCPLPSAPPASKPPSTPSPTPLEHHDRPKNPKDLARLVRSLSRTSLCYCETCYPGFTYDWVGPCGRWVSILFTTHIYPNRYGHRVLSPLRLYQAPVYEPLYLVRSAIYHFGQPKEWFNEVQLRALDEILAWIQRRKDDLLCWAQPDRVTGTLLDNNELWALWKNINRLFFASGMPRYISWNRMLPTCILGQTGIEVNRLVRIDMNPHIHQSSILFPLMLDLLGTLLHEAVHAFIMHHSYDEYGIPVQRSLGMRGHGRPWQMLAAKVEESWLRLTGLPVLLGRWEAMSCHWEDMGALPCEHDLEAWRMDAEEWVVGYMGEVFEAYGEVGDKGNFRPVEFYERWWRRWLGKRGEGEEEKEKEEKEKEEEEKEDRGEEKKGDVDYLSEKMAIVDLGQELNGDGG